MRKVFGFHGRPEEFNGRQLRRIRRIALHPKPRFLALDVVCNHASFVCGKAIPDEEQFPAIELFLDVLQKINEIIPIHGSWLESEVDFGIVSPRRKEYEPRHREAFP